MEKHAKLSNNYEEIHCYSTCTDNSRTRHDVNMPMQYTVKFLNFRTPENFAIIYLKFKEKRPNLCVFLLKEANGIANSEDPDQTAPLGAV